MKKSEIFDVLVKKVCEVCEVRYDMVIKGSKLQSVVDARVLPVQYFRRIGLTNDAIAKLLSYEEGESTDAQANKKTTAF